MLSLGMVSLPVVVATFTAYLNFRVVDPYLVAGFGSLIMIVMADRFQWFGIALVYLPALWCLYLLVFEGNPLPFVSLAAGYILAVPLVVLGSTLAAKTSWGMLGGYVGSYALALLILSATVNGGNTPEKLFVYIVRMYGGQIASNLGLSLSPPSVEQEINPGLLATPTAFSALGLILNFMSGDNKPPMKSTIRINPLSVRALLISLGLTAIATYLSLAGGEAISALAIGSAAIASASILSRLRGKNEGS